MAITKVTRTLLSTGIVDNSNATAITIDSSENVGIGTTSPSAPLNISATYSSDTTEQFRIQDNTGGKLDFFGYANGGKGIQAYADNGSTFYNLNLQPLGGNVGIGITSLNEGKLHVKSDDAGEVELLTLENSTGTNGKTTLTFKTTSTDSTKSAQIFAERVNASGHTDLAFRTFNGSTTEAARIDHDGNLLVGKTSADAGDTAGVELRGGIGFAAISRSGDVCANFSRLTNDGNIVAFRKDSTDIGHIGVVSGNNLNIYSASSGHSGVSFGTGIVYATDNSGDATNGATSLGSSSYKWNNIHLSGTANAASLSVDGGTIKLDGNYPNGSDNVAVGNSALQENTTGTQNTAVGSLALDANTTGVRNTAIGYGTLGTVSTGENNTAVGQTALFSNTTASNNTAVGKSALLSNTTGTRNTAVGMSAGLAITTGSYNVAMGAFAGDAITTGEQNTAIGDAALTALTTGTENTSIGDQSLKVSTASFNTAVGSASLKANTSGTSNTAIGRAALTRNTTASNNTAVGHNSLDHNTTGTRNAALGTYSLDANTTASDNTGVGYAALSDNTTGASNTAFGSEALLFNSTASNNTAVGSDALRANTTGASNTAVGRNAGDSITTGGSNTVIGEGSGSSLTTGTDSTFVGQDAGSLVTGSKNTILGCYNGNQSGLDIRTSSNHIVLSDGDGNTRLYLTNNGYLYVPAIGYGGATSDVNYNTSTGEIYVVSSSQRYKENISEYTDSILQKVNNLTVKNFDYKEGGYINQIGLIAEEVEEQIPHLVNKKEIEGYDEPQPDSVKYSQLSVFLLKAIQEQQTIIDDLKSRIETLEG